MTTNWNRRVKALAAVPALALSLAASAGGVAHAVEQPSIDPAYSLNQTTFERVQTDAAYRSAYHYIPQFQPVENQCSNVEHGDWARVTCWTDDGDNLIVRVEFVHPRVTPTAIRVKHDTAHTVTGGQLIGKSKQFEIPADQRTPDGHAYAVFNLEYFEGQSFYIDAFAKTSTSQWAWSDFNVSVTQNVNRNTDAEPVVARQATVYDSNFYKLSQPLQFEKIVEVDGTYKAVYSMVNANEAEADLVDQIQIWPVDSQTYTWRPESEDGTWAPFVEVPERAMGCQPQNTDVPRLGYKGLGANTGFITYTKDSAEYPLIREGAKTSIMVDVQPGWERIQYETWMNGCANPFGRPGQMRPYQGQVVLPEYAVLDINKVLGGNGAEAATTANLEFGGTAAYPEGSVTASFADPSGWTGLDWTGTRQWNYPANSLDWAATVATPWRSPLLPAGATVTVTETVVPTVADGEWELLAPEAVTVGSDSLANITTIGAEKVAVSSDITLTPACLTPEASAAVTPAEASKTDGNGSVVATATVANLLTLAECPPEEPPTTPPATPDTPDTPTTPPTTPDTPDTPTTPPATPDTPTTPPATPDTPTTPPATPDTPTTPPATPRTHVVTPGTPLTHTVTPARAELPSTGAEVSGMLGAASVLVLLGSAATAVAIRNRKREQNR